VQTVNQALLETRNTGITKMLSSKPQVKDLWAELKGSSKKVLIQPINPFDNKLALCAVKENDEVNLFLFTIFLSREASSR
jgi:hypothetical protein